MITVFTATYNRANDLRNLYQSLLNQTYTDFVWLLLDDGSSDQTKNVVQEWINDGKIKIKYQYQENQGRFAAFNNAQPFFEGDLMCICDSDDWFESDGLMKIWKKWNSVDQTKFSGILAYAKMENGNLVGTGFPDGIDSERIYTIYDKYKVKGDKFICFRTDMAKKYQYPVYPGEKFGGDAIVFCYINKELPMVLLREPITIKKTDGDTITNNLKKYHLNSKNGMRDKYRVNLEFEKYNIANICKHTLGYVAYSIATNVSFYQIVKKSPKKLLTILMFPVASIYYRLHLKNYNG